MALGQSTFFLDYTSKQTVMRKVPLQEVEDGMILAAPLTGASGSILMGKGIALRASIVPRLAAWGVTHLLIEGDPTPEEMALAHGAKNSTASLERLFEGKTNTKAMNIIYHSLMKHRSHSVHG